MEMDWAERLEKRLARLEQRTRRDHEHLMTVMAVQRGRIEKAFDEVKLALLEQEVAVRQRLTNLEEEFQDLRELVQELGSGMVDHERRLRELERRPPAG